MPRLRAILALALLGFASGADAAPPHPRRVRRPGETAPAPGGAPLSVTYRATPLVAAHDGKTVRIAVPPGSLATLDGQAYELLNVHFHAPPADRGARRDGLAVHLVHLGSDERPLVIVALVDPGPASAALGALLARLPSEPGESRTYARTPLNPADLLPRGLAHAEVEGDDADGCVPGGARRLVLAARLTASKPQLDSFRRLLRPSPPEPPATPRRSRRSHG